MADTRGLWYKVHRVPSVKTAPKLVGRVIRVNFVTLAESIKMTIGHVEVIVQKSNLPLCIFRITRPIITRPIYQTKVAAAIVVLLHSKFHLVQLSRVVNTEQ